MTKPKVTDYDAWHLHTEGMFPTDQPPEQGYVHIGMYVAWLSSKGFISKSWAKKSEALEIQREMDGRRAQPTALRDVSGGKLSRAMLTEEGDAFTSAYYVPEFGYPRDWQSAFGRKADLYAVPDGWVTFDRIAPQIDRQLDDWLERGRPEFVAPPSLLPIWLTPWRMFRKRRRQP
jgi:hypothetical protein